MRHLSKGMAALVAACGLVVGGCGGHVPDSSGTSRGEGTIPIGKITTKPAPPVQVTAFCADGTTQSGTVTSDGTLLMPPLPYGQTVLRLVPQGDEFEPAEYSVDVRAHQRAIISVSLQAKDPAAFADGVAIELPNGKDLQAGKSYPIKVTALGKNAASLKPTVWVNGGVGSVEGGLRFVALVPGEGAICAQIGAARALLPIVVR